VVSEAFGRVLRVTQTATLKSVNARLAEELAIGEAQVVAAVKLLDDGATVPFIARYRKEATGSLDDGQLRALEERLRYLRNSTNAGLRCWRRSKSRAN
jgi:uncharacterized protein